jgi:chlorite dismutase
MPDRVESRCQIVSFSFLKVNPSWRLLPVEERTEQKQEFQRALERWATNEMRILSYSTMGLRGDCDMLLWRICYSLDCLSSAHSDMMKTSMGAYLSMTHSFLAMTRRSEYLIGHEDSNPAPLRGYIRPGNHKYMMVYPYTKTRTWYQLPFEDRQRMIQELMRLIDEVPGIHMHTMYSLGIDDQEFVIAVEADRPQDVIETAMKLREIDNYNYVAVDSPRFTCIRTSIPDMLERLG